LISIQSAMLIALGFLAASLLGLLVASAFWARAVRLTTARIKQSMPVSEPEIKADRDRLRAEYAIRVHKLETQLEQARLQRARHLIEISRREASISQLETGAVALKADLEENQNARRVLEQTVVERLPKVEARLAEAKRLLFNRDREIAELMAGAKRHKLALEEASSINAQQTAQIERLSTALTRGGRKAIASGPRQEGELALRAEIDALRTKTREQAMLIDRLQRRLGQGYVLPPPAGSQAAGNGLEGEDEEVDQLREELSAAETALSTVRAAAAEGDTARQNYEREIRGLKARAEDQAGEIARLKAALATLEQAGPRGGSRLKDSKLALKARLGSAEAQAEQQAATIGRLRAELAATHERLARQAAHFMDEMRRLGSGPRTGPGQGRRTARGERRTLAERVHQVHTGAPEKVALARPSAIANGGEASGSNGRESTEPPTGAGAAAEMPKAPQISGERRRLRLLDRIAGLAKG
jgi:chromosome segregation ATPase